jgi:hypothetical protein
VLLTSHSLVLVAILVRQCCRSSCRTNTHRQFRAAQHISDLAQLNSIMLVAFPHIHHSLEVPQGQ